MTKPETIRIFCKNTGKYYKVEPGTTLAGFLEQTGYNGIEITDGNNKKYKLPPLAAYVDNQLKELSYSIYMAHSIEFLDYSNADGKRTYLRSLNFVLQKAIKDLYPDKQLILDYTLPNGGYGEITYVPKDEKSASDLTHRINGVMEVSEEQVYQIKEKMREIINANIPIVKKKLSNDEAIALFTAHKQYDKAALFRGLGKFFVSVYFIDTYGDTFYGPMLHNTGAIDKFNLIKYNKGFCVQFPDSKPPFDLPCVKYQEKLFEVFKENSNWCTILGAKDIASINDAISKGFGTAVVQIAEGLHERKYADIADMIYKKKDDVKLVLIAGPSSSGKTTTSKRIALQLKVIGLNPVIIEMDNYFVNREHTPKDEKGEYDFECLQAMDLKLLNEQLNQLFDGKEIELPKFNFAKGERYYDGTKIKLGPNDILIMEGIHALNPGLTNSIDNKKKFRIYASALTSLSIDENNSISTTDNRLLRRMVRDNNFRGITAEQTILRWQSVRNGENKNIFPFQENADAMFNSSLIYELPMLKHYAEPLLRRISPTSPAYAESLRLLKFLSYIIELTPNEQKGIPPTSVMREFIGGSSFVY